MDKIKKQSQIELRPITIEDTEMVLQWRNGQNVRPYFIYQKDITVEDHHNWLKNKVETGLVKQFIIYDEEKVPIGSVYIQDIDYVHRKAEYGIFLGNNLVQGKGYGTEAARKMIRYAFDVLKLHRLYLRVFEDNARAISSYEKAGFKKEALLEDDVFVNGRYRNIVIMGIVNKEE